MAKLENVIEHIDKMLLRRAISMVELFNTRDIFICHLPFQPWFYNTCAVSRIGGKPWLRTNNDKGRAAFDDVALNPGKPKKYIFPW